MIEDPEIFWGDDASREEFLRGWHGKTGDLPQVRTTDTLLWVTEGPPPPVEMGWFLRALAHGAAVVVGSTRWGRETWQALATRVRPSIVYGPVPRLDWNGPPLAAGAVVFRTGGSTGVPRFAVHQRETLTAAALSLQEELAPGQPLSFTGHLPLYHVSGFMPWWRAIVTGGSFVPNPLVVERPRGFLLASVVPTTLRRAMVDEDGRNRLAACDCVMGGGAAFSDDLRLAAKAAGIPLRLVYGLTETAGVVAIDSGSGEIPPLLHPCPAIELQCSDDGEILLSGRQLFRGYLGQQESVPQPWRTGDLGRMQGDGLQLLGRRGDFIHSGGETISLERVAGALRECAGVRDAQAYGWPDPAWGERLEAVVVGDVDLDGVRESLRQRLDRVQIPQGIRIVETIPRQENGKIDGRKWREMLEEIHRGERDG